MEKRRLIRGFIQIFALFLFAQVFFAAENLVQSKWTASPLQVDGQNGEWLDEAMAFEKSVAVDYAFRNDGRNLYVLFMFKNPKYLSSVEMSGITLYFNTLGKKDKDYGVRFVRKTVNAEQLIAYLEKQGQTLTEEAKQGILDKQQQYVIFSATAVNKKGEDIFPAVAPQDVDPPGFKIGRQQNVLTYEFRIPLVSREIHPAGIGTEPGKDLKVGFEWGGLTKEMKEAMKGQRSSRGTGADMTTETTGGDYEGSPAPGAAGPKKYSFWADVKLATAQ